MSLDILYIAKTLKKLASTSRFAGSTGEAKAKEFVISQLESFGLYVKLQPFQVDVYNIEKARLEVLNPPLGVVACHGVGFSGVTHDEGVVNFARFSGSGVNMHTELDDDRFVHEVAYLVFCRLVAEFLNRIANAEKLPFAKEIPEKLKKKVDEHFKKRLGIFDGKE